MKATELHLKAETLKIVLRESILEGLKVLIVGEPGTGKTSIAKDAIASLHAELLISTPAIEEPTDSRGFPTLNNTDGKIGATFVPFGNLEKILSWNGGEDGTKLLVPFLDDLGQAMVSVQKAKMPLLLGGTLDGKQIAHPELIRFIGATNRINGTDGVDEIIQPLLNRFDLILNFEPSVKDWISNFGAANCHSFVCSYLSRFPDHLYHKDEGDPDTISNHASPRTWGSASKVIDLSHKIGLSNADLTTCLIGALGESVGSSFGSFVALGNKCPDPYDVLKDPTNHPIDYDSDVMFILIGSLAKIITSQFEADDAMTYVERCHDELIWLFISLLKAYTKKNGTYNEVSKANGITKFYANKENAEIGLLVHSFMQGEGKA